MERNVFFLTKMFLGILLNLSLSLWFYDAKSMGAMHVETKACINISDTNSDHELEKLLDRIKYVDRSCKEILDKYHVYEDGLYYLISPRGVLYQTFCDMTTAGGRWWPAFMKTTCMESVLLVIAGLVSRAATSDDYKNSGYFEIVAQDVSVWHVPNNMALEKWSTASILHTENRFLTLHEGKLLSLFKKFPVRFGIGNCNIDNGPAIPIVYDTGNMDSTNKLYGPNSRAIFEPGYSSHSESSILKRQPWQFVRALNQPVVTLNTSVLVEVDTFLRRSQNSAGTLRVSTGMANTGWSASKEITEAAVLLFYR